MGGDIVFSTVVNIILSIRLNAMYQKTTVLVFLLTIFAAHKVELYVSVKAAISTEHAVFPAPVDIWPGCVSNPDTHFTLISWIPTLVIQFIFFLLTIAKLFDDGRWKPSFLKEMATLSPLFVAFIRDGSVFFFLIFAIVLASALCSLLVKGPLLNMVQPWLTAIYSFSVSRLVLNIRELAHRGNMDTNGSSLARRTAPPLVFAHGRSGDSVGQEESEAQVADEHELELGIFSDAYNEA
ncbi:hypothetical protein B0H11DRAFT_1278044 [Mycena galericulata]|nr:hypothetical protein B0H11DRAFT_1278044 [Mycena galericulata]